MTAQKRYKIALVDDNKANLDTAKSILKERFEVYPVQSGQLLLKIMEQVTPDLILLDVEMPGMNGYETLRQLKISHDLLFIPVIFLSANTDVGSEMEGLALGAVDYIYKPFSAPLLIKRIENHISTAEKTKKLQFYNAHLQEEVDRGRAQVLDLQNAMLGTISELVEYRDEVTGGHIDRTQSYLKLLLEDMVTNGIYKDELDSWDLELVVLSAPLHDTGKIAISDAILNKPGKLTPEEFEIMKKHVDYGVWAIEDMEKRASENSFLHHAKIIAASHHEKWDGSGYPKGLRGHDIPLQGRLMAVADVYDALTSVRPYKSAMSKDRAKQIILEGSGTHFDPELVYSFLRVADRFAAIAASFNQAQPPRLRLLAS
jgi:putative two-component system response regulator